MSNRTIEATVKLSAKMGSLAAFSQLSSKMADVNNKAAAINRAQTAIARSSRLQAAAFTWQDTALASHNARMMAVAAQRQRQAVASRAALMRGISTPALVAGGVGAVGIAAGAGAVRGFATLERRLERIGINADATSAQMESAFGRVRDIANDLGTPVENVISGLESLIASGKSLDEAMALLPTVAAAAHASDSEFMAMATTADAITGSFKIAADQMGIAFDIIAKAGKAGKFEMKDMAAELPSLAPAFAALGYKGEEGLKKLAAALQVVRMETGTSGEAATAFMDVLTKMNSVTVANNFKKQFGVDIRKEMDKARASGEDLLMAFIRLSKEAVHGDLSKIPLLFTDKQMQIAMRALINRTGEYTSQVEALGDAFGTVQGDVDRLATNVQTSIDKMANSWERLKTSIAGTIAPPAVVGMDAISNTIDDQAAMDRGFEKMGMGFIESRIWSMMNGGNPEALKSVFWLGGGRTEEDKKKIEAYRAQGADPRFGVDTPDLADGQTYQTRGLPEEGPTIQTRDGTVIYPEAAKTVSSVPAPASPPDAFEAALSEQRAEQRGLEADMRREGLTRLDAPVPDAARAPDISVRPAQHSNAIDAMLRRAEDARLADAERAAAPAPWTWKGFMLGDAARPDFSFKQAMAIDAGMQGPAASAAAAATPQRADPDTAPRLTQISPDMQDLPSRIEQAGSQAGTDLAQAGKVAADAIAAAAPLPPEFVRMPQEGAPSGAIEGASDIRGLGGRLEQAGTDLAQAGRAAADAISVAAPLPPEFERMPQAQPLGAVVSAAAPAAPVAFPTVETAGSPLRADPDMSLRPTQIIPEMQGLLAQLEQTSAQSGSDLAKGGEDAASAISQAAPEAGNGFGDAAAARIKSSAALAGAEFGDAAAARIRAAAGSIRSGTGGGQLASGNEGRSMPNAGTRPGGT